MKVEALEAIKHHPFYPSIGDQITVPDEVGENWVQNGWAKNLDTGEENPRSDHPVTLDIEKSTLGVTSTEV